MGTEPCPTIYVESFIIQTVTLLHSIDLLSPSVGTAVLLETGSTASTYAPQVPFRV